MDLKLLKMLCKDSKQHHVKFHEFYSVSSLLCIAQNVRFEISYKVLYFETPFLMIFKYYAWASYAKTASLFKMAARQPMKQNLHCTSKYGHLRTSQDICHVRMTDIEGFLTIYGHSDNLLNNN